MVILAAGVFKDGRYLTLRPFVAFSDKQGLNFSQLENVTFGRDISPTLDWIWRVTWHKGIGYGIMYSLHYEMKKGKRIRTMQASLLRTKNGRHFEKVSPIDIDGSPNESTIRFDKNNKMYILVRRETEDQMGVIASSESPYKKWQFNKLNSRLGGPNFLFFKQG